MPFHSKSWRVWRGLFPRNPKRHPRRHRLCQLACREICRVPGKRVSTVVAPGSGRLHKTHDCRRTHDVLCACLCNGPVCSCSPLAVRRRCSRAIWSRAISLKLYLIQPYCYPLCAKEVFFGLLACIAFAQETRRSASASLPVQPWGYGPAAADDRSGLAAQTLCRAP